MPHGHFRGCLRFSFAELKKPAIYIFFQNLHLLSFPTIYSLPCFPLKWRAYEFFPRGHPRRSEVTLRPEIKCSRLPLLFPRPIQLAREEKEPLWLEKRISSICRTSNAHYTGPTWFHTLVLTVQVFRAVEVARLTSFAALQRSFLFQRSNS